MPFRCQSMFRGYAIILAELCLEKASEERIQFQYKLERSIDRAIECADRLARIDAEITRTSQMLLDVQREHEEWHKSHCVHDCEANLPDECLKS